MRLKWGCLSGLITLALLPIQTAVNAETLGRPSMQGQGLGCRRINVTTGVYAQPSLSSATQGILAQAQIVHLESAAQGWARVTQPLIGWVEARYLSPPIACDAQIGPSATSRRPPTVPSTQSRPYSPPLVISKPSATGLTVVCRVTSPNGLAVRREPTLDAGVFITSLAQGEHNFSFTGQTTRTANSLGTLTWLYITAPREGWITAGYVGQPPTITGDRCG